MRNLRHRQGRKNFSNKNYGPSMDRSKLISDQKHGHHKGVDYISNMLKSKDYQLRILYLAILSFKNEEIKTFSVNKN